MFIGDESNLSAVGSIMFSMYRSFLNWLPGQSFVPGILSLKCIRIQMCIRDRVRVVFGYRGGMYGFISSHAANAFGFATLMALIFRNKLFGWTIFFWAILTSYTRIYLGVHFITDIIPGALSGLLFGYLVYLLYHYIRPKLIPADSWVCPEAIYSDIRKRWITYAIWLTILLIALFNEQLVSCLI